MSVMYTLWVCFLFCFRDGVRIRGDVHERGGTVLAHLLHRADQLAADVADVHVQ